MLMKNVDLQLVGPPVLIGSPLSGSMINRTFTGIGDGRLLALMIEWATARRLGLIVFCVHDLLMMGKFFEVISLFGNSLIRKTKQKKIILQAWPA